MKGLVERNLPSPDSKRAIKGNVAHHRQSDTLTPLEKAALQEYYDALKGITYAPLKAMELRIIEVTRKANLDHADLAFQRACKFGREFVIMTRMR